jgi:copper resistance protein B
MKQTLFPLRTARGAGSQRSVLSRVVWACALLLTNGVSHSHGNDDPLLSMVSFDELEWRGGSGDDELVWRGEAWVGTNEHKLLLKTRGERTSDTTEEFELQLLYNQAIAPFWDLQFGWRGDFQPVDERNWFALGVEGLAPGFIETELTAFAGSSGRTAARTRFSYEMLLTQKLVLEPELELAWFGKDDPSNAVGSGISSIEAGLRLHYRIVPELAPYIGINWTGLHGDTKRYARAEGEDASKQQLVAGLSFWF